MLVSQSERTQLMNKIIVIEKFYDLVSKALDTSKEATFDQTNIIIKNQKARRKTSQGKYQEDEKRFR